MSEEGEVNENSTKEPVSGMPSLTGEMQAAPIQVPQVRCPPSTRMEQILSIASLGYGPAREARNRQHEAVNPNAFTEALRRSLELLDLGERRPTARAAES